MHEIVIISGKGGAGKTSITGAFAQLAENAILCDLDVDAPDLHLLLSPKNLLQTEFRSGNEAVIDSKRCDRCGLCASLCKFDAIKFADRRFKVAPFRCEGCKVCVELCPAGAISFPEKHCGSWYISETRFGKMVHAQLFPGEENSGRLVTLLKQKARKIAEHDGQDLMLCDGAPGIGCPVISSMAGTDLAVVVTEPTPSGRHDFERVVELCNQFRTKVAVIINKCDLNSDEVSQIEKYCTTHGHPVICHFPHDRSVTDAMVKGQVITEYDTGAAKQLLESAWKNMLNILYTNKPKGD